MTQPKKCIATEARRWMRRLLLPLCLLAALPAWAAQVIGTVTQLSGPLMVKRADGSARVLGLKSEVQDGDTLITEKNTYAMLKLIDNSEITLKPDTTFVIDKFSFEGAKPENDSAAFSLVRGGLRSVTGLLGKRNKERFGLKTPTATIGIRGTTFVVQYVGAPADAAPPSPVAGAVTPPAPSTAPALPPGLYVQVTDGQIVVSNQGGATSVVAGQFGYTPNIQQPPVIVPTNPGLQFSPPPVFTAPVAGAASAATGSKPGEVDCIVR